MNQNKKPKISIDHVKYKDLTPEWKPMADQWFRDKKQPVDPEMIFRIQVTE